MTVRRAITLNRATGTPQEVGTAETVTRAPVKTLAADIAAATAITYSDVTGLAASVAAGTAYQFIATLVWRSAAITTGARFSINGPASPTVLAYTARWTGATDTTESVYASNAYDGGTASTGVAVAAADRLAVIEGIIVPSVAGTLIPRVASEVAASGITVRRGSTFEVIELA